MEDSYIKYQQAHINDQVVQKFYEHILSCFFDIIRKARVVNQREGITL